MSGLWHGANWTFIVWGALHGIYVMVEKYFGIGKADEEKLLAKTPSIELSKAKSFIKKLTKQWLTFFLVCFAWIFFRADSVADAFTIITSAMHLNFSGLGINITSIDIIYFSVAGIIILEIVQRIMQGNEFFNLMINQPRWIRLTAYHLLIISILAFGVFNNSQFIYFQF